MTTEDDRLAELHATVKAAFAEYDAGRRAEAASVGDEIPQVRTLADVDPARLLEELGNRGVVVLRRETLTAMEAATHEATERPAVAELDVHAVVDLLGHTRRVGRLTNCAEIPGLVQLTGTDGTVRWVNPLKAIFEVEVITEEEVGKRARPAGAAWDSARGRVVGDDPWRSDGVDDPPFDVDPNSHDDYEGGD